MRQKIDRRLAAALATGTLLFASAFLQSCAGANVSPDLFPKDHHPLIPLLPHAETQISAGAVTGEAPLQPIAFPHDRHVQGNGMQCQYCHSAARNSIHAGVPEISVCIGCHKESVQLAPIKDSKEIELLREYWKRGEAVPWKKVHDLPDFVYFSHMRHVRAGVDCTECHGQVQTMAGTRVPSGSGHAEPAEGQALTPAEAAAVTLGDAQDTMTREATLQMGWCLDCHASHPSVDKNYGDKANLRRAELKDCWTCHK